MSTSEPPGARGPSPVPASALLWLSVSALAAWTRWPSPLWLLASAVAGSFAVLDTLSRSSGRNPWLRGTAFVLMAGIASGFLGSARLGLVASDWERFRAAREAGLEEALGQRFEDLIDRGTGAVSRAATRELDGEAPGYWTFLDDVRRDAGLHAMAVFTAQAELVAWAGNHQGIRPLEARTGRHGYMYGEGPVNAYLYFTRHIGETGATAVGVALLQSNLPPGVPEDESAFTTRLQAEAGGAIRVSRPEQATGTAIRDLSWQDRVLFSISFDEVTQGAAFESVRQRWSRAVAAFAVLAWLLLVIGLRGTRYHAPLAGLVLGVLALWLPLGDLLGVSGLFSPAQFLLPGTAGGTLGRVVALGLTGVFVAGLLPDNSDTRGSRVLGAAIGGVGFAAVIHWFSLAPTTSYLGGGADYWLLYQCALCLALALVTIVALRLAGRNGPAHARPVLVLAGLTLALGLGLVTTIWFRSSPSFRHGRGCRGRSPWVCAPSGCGPQGTGARPWPRAPQPSCWP